MAFRFDSGVFSVEGLDGEILPGTTLGWFESGTSTPLETYSDPALTVANPNPVTVTADGRIPAIWLQEDPYKLVVTLPDGTILTRDPIQNPGAAGLEKFDELAEGSGAGLVGFDPNEAFPGGTVGAVLNYGRALTPADFADLVSGGRVANGQNDTPAFEALAAAYNAGRAIHFPDLGQPYLIDPDKALFTPPASYNNLNRPAPAITADASAVIRARSGGVFLVQLGTVAGDYSGYLRNCDFQLPTIDGYNFAFTKAPLYVPFYRELRLKVTVKNAKRAIYSGDIAAPGFSAGIKGPRTYERDLELWRRDAIAITNAVNPVVTFPVSHGLWPASGRRCICLNFFGAPAGWNAITNKSLDCLVTSATTVQLLNVDSTGYGAMTGFAACYLNMESVRIAKKITGVTNANPAVVTTNVPHLFTSGDLVDVAEIGGMCPDQYRPAPFTGLQGQYTVTVLTATTFSIPVDTTSTATYGAYNAALGPGWAMGWVAPVDCDIAEYHENATDVDDSEVYSFHFRIHQYHNAAVGGYDGKHYTPHFYNFPESGEALCHYYAGGDNHFSGVQSDGPFRYVLMLFGPNNTANGCKTNTGYIDPRHQYGAFARGMNSTASLEASQLGLKGRPSFQLWSDWSGPGTYSTDGSNRYNSVMVPITEYGARRIAASVNFGMSDGIPVTNFQCGATFIRTPGGFSNGDRVVNFLRPVPLTAVASIGAPGGAAAASQAATIEEDTGWSGRSVFERRIITRIGGTPADLNQVPLTWRYPT